MILTGLLRQWLAISVQIGQAANEGATHLYQEMCAIEESIRESPAGSLGDAIAKLAIALSGMRADPDLTADPNWRMVESAVADLRGLLPEAA